MQITLPDDINIQAQATAAGFAAVEDYVAELLERDAERVAIQKGINDFKAGRVQLFDKFDTDLRQEFGFSPRK